MLLMECNMIVNMAIIKGTKQNYMGDNPGFYGYDRNSKI